MSTVYIRFAARAADRLQRSPSLERLLKRAATPVRVADWRADAWALLEHGPLPPIGPAALSLAAKSPAAPAGAAWVCVATPVRLTAGMSSVSFPWDGMLELETAELDALAADFNAVFKDAGVRLTVVHAVTLLCLFQQALEVTSHDPDSVLGRDVFDFQPRGRDAPRLLRLMTEIEMWLFEHALNRSRTAQGRPAITGLWLWGGGAPLAPLTPPPLWAAGRDALFAAFGAATQFPPAAPSDAAATARRGGVVVCDAVPGTPAWTAAEQRWLAPALAQLRSGGIRLLHVAAAERRFTVAPGIDLRFWRRARPWWQSFDLTNGDLHDGR